VLQRAAKEVEETAAKGEEVRVLPWFAGAVSAAMEEVKVC